MEGMLRNGELEYPGQNTLIRKPAVTIGTVPITIAKPKRASGSRH